MTSIDIDRLVAEHPGGRPGFELPASTNPAEAMYALGLTDGLPVVPPTPDLVAAMLEAGPWSPDTVLAEVPTRDVTVTAYLAAVNAVMAGARTEYFPVIGTALEAIGQPDFHLHLPTASTGGATIMVIVHGPVADAIGVHARENLFGPGFRANATIGRTIRLVQMNCLAAIPGELDKSTQGWPGKFSLCFAENTEASPWPPLNERLGCGGRSAVTVFASESGHNVVTHGAADAESMLLTFAGAMAGLGSFSPGRSVVVFAPEHAKRLGDAGWSADDVAEFLYQHAVQDLATLKRVGKIEDDPEADNDWTNPVWRTQGDIRIHPGDENVLIRRGYGPQDITVLVGGGTAGGHSAFFPSWSRARSVPIITKELPS
ncbi:MAG: hypothetical protein AAF567_04650 [Actinomycetota bacterium]